MKTPEITEEDPGDPEPTDDRDITVELLLWLIVQSKCRSSNKWLPVKSLG